MRRWLVIALVLGSTLAHAQEPPKPASLPEATWTQLRIDIAEQQTRESQMARMQAEFKVMQAEAVGGARALEAEVSAAAKVAGVDLAKCYPDAKARTWISRSGNPQDSCLVKAEPKK